jgi:hypothetical protein
MNNSSRILSLIVVMPVVLACIGPVNAGEIYREGIFLASLERSDAQSLPPVVSTTSPTSFPVSSPRTIPVGAQRDGAPDSIRFSVMQENAESVTHVVSEFVDSGGDQPVSAGPVWESGMISCQACLSQADEGWLCRKSDQLNRKIYFSRQGNHKKSLYPVIRPYCQPAYGVYETCWRQIQPNNCCYRSLEPYGDPSLLPVPQTPLVPQASPEGTPLQKIPPYEQ